MSTDAKTDATMPKTGLAVMDPTGRVQTFKKILWDSRAQWTQALPQYLTPERMFTVVINCLLRTPKLMECDAASLLRCIAQCAELGLEPGGALGQAYLVPFAKECTLIIGYRGFLELARRSGSLLQGETHIVYTKDRFVIEHGLEPKLVHSPHLGSDRGPPVAVYFIGRLNNGEKHVEIMPWDEVMKIKARALSRAPKGPWAEPDFEPEMARKTVIRRAAKYMALDGKLRDALEREDELGDVIDSKTVTPSAAPALPEKSASETITAALDAAISGQLGDEEKAAIIAAEAEQSKPKQEEAKK
jgi:recombination protein RecT